MDGSRLRRRSFVFWMFYFSIPCSATKKPTMSLWGRLLLSFGNRSSFAWFWSFSFVELAYFGLFYWTTIWVAHGIIWFLSSRKICVISTSFKDWIAIGLLFFVFFFNLWSQEHILIVSCKYLSSLIKPVLITRLFHPLSHISQVTWQT